MQSRARRGRACPRAVAVAAAGAFAPLLRVAHRSGVSDADVVRTLAGDGADRGRRDPDRSRDRGFRHRPARSGRGSCSSGRVERAGTCPAGWSAWSSGRPSARSARRSVAEFQALAAGESVPDWGPGNPSFRVTELDPPRALVYPVAARPRPQLDAAQRRAAVERRDGVQLGAHPRRDRRRALSAAHPAAGSLRQARLATAGTDASGSTTTSVNRTAQLISSSMAGADRWHP